MLRLPPPIVFFWFIPLSIKYCSYSPVPSTLSPRVFDQELDAVTLLQFIQSQTVHPRPLSWPILPPKQPTAAILLADKTLYRHFTAYDIPT